MLPTKQSVASHATRGWLKNNYELNTKANLLDSEQHRMIVGDKYEIFIPIAKMSEQQLGLVFDDDVGYTFTYAGSYLLGDTEYIASPDVTYTEESLPKGATDELIHLLSGKGVAHPLCPHFVAANFVRPATGE